MSILTKYNIIEEFKNNKIIFSPELDAFQMQPAAVDIRLGWSFYIPKTWKFDEKGRSAVVADYFDTDNLSENYQLIKLKPGQYFEILPGESIVASTLEKISINTGLIMGILYPRSSSSRRGLSIESGVIDPFYSGNLIIPMVNNTHHALKIYPGERICQIVFYNLKQEISKEDAAKHGLQDSKYNTATPYSLESKPDHQEETELLKQGNVEQLKQQFPIQDDITKNPV
ncbi:MAG: 2'-deoxycytidine 5'-triphosphate deaminase [Patescibacteria group bacterium]|nr:2'-deoxycytidine 5'-triphosphate deaminase [Patescibacteria group bacterium]